MERESLDLTNFDVFLIDLDGVLVRSSEPIPGAKQAMEKLRRLGTVLVFSNNSTKSRKNFSRRLKKMGLDINPEAIVNSAFIASDYIYNTYGNSAVYPVGEEGLDEELELGGHELVQSEEADFVVAGMDRGLTYDKLSRALSGLLNGARFIATNPDGTFPVPGGEAPGAGATVGAIKGMGFEPEEIVGKPSSIAVEAAMDASGIDDPEKMLLIGDRLETDILCANNAGIRSVMVLSGVSTEQDINQTDIEPTWVRQDLAQLL